MENLAQLLISYGIDKETANKTASLMNGNDALSVVSHLNNPVDVTKANAILSKYGIVIPDSEKGTQMAKESKGPSKLGKGRFTPGSEPRAGAFKKDTKAALAKVDPEDRRVLKHKKSTSLDERYDIGESVMFNNKMAKVKISEGPGNTIGILVDDKLRMVSPDDVSRIDETIMGMTRMPVQNINRLQQLAGIKSSKLSEDLPSAVMTPPDLDDPMSHFPTEFTFGDEDLEDDNLGITDDLPMDDTMDIGNSISDLPVDSSPIVTPPVGVAPSTSVAFTQIEDALNNIQRQLADIRLSEYKILVKKLETLTNQVKLMGNDFLGDK